MLTDEQVRAIREWNEKDRARYAIVRQPAIHCDNIAALLADRNELRAALRKIEDLCEEINDIARYAVDKGETK